MKSPPTDALPPPSPLTLPLPLSLPPSSSLPLPLLLRGPACSSCGTPGRPLLFFFIGALIFKEVKKLELYSSSPSLSFLFLLLTNFQGTRLRIGNRTYTQSLHTTTARRRSLNLLGCSPARRDHDTSFDSRETGEFHLADALGAATVIEV